MNQHRSEKLAAGPWRVAVAVQDIPDAGLHVALAADAEARDKVARMAGLRDLPRLEADFDLTRHGSDGVRVVGRVSASVGQTCVVSLEPVVNEVTEGVDLLFVPLAAGLDLGETDPREAASDARWDDPEPLVDGTIDLGALATEFLVLGLDSYPRRPGAIFESHELQPQASLFAALAGWTKGRDDT